jgi:hypothetical protein
MTIYVAIILSTLLNVGLLWYTRKLLTKFLFISSNMADLYLIMKAFRVFVGSLYKMTSYNGEPMIEELIERLREVTDEIEKFRSIFEVMLDEELEGELDAAEDEAQTIEI